MDHTTNKVVEHAFSLSHPPKSKSNILPSQPHELSLLSIAYVSLIEHNLRKNQTMSSRGISSEPRGRQRPGSRLFTRIRQKVTGSTKPAARPSDPNTQRKDDEGLLDSPPTNVRPEAAQSLNSLDPSHAAVTGLLSVPSSNIRQEVTQSLDSLSPSDGRFGNGLTVSIYALNRKGNDSTLT
jgi:hypothetical protein